MSSVPTSGSPPQGTRGREWLSAGAAVAAFGAWTLTPFELRPADPSELFAVALDDAVGNLLVAVPIGWLLAAAVGVRRAVIAMALLSLGVETSQLLVATRSAALSDVVANTTGAAAGALWWRRPHGAGVANAMMVAVACWGVASRYGAPGRPMLTVAILLALAMALVREDPAESPDAAGFALVSASGFLGLSPEPLVFVALAALTAGTVFARSLRAWRRPLAATAPIAFAVETWPPLRVAANRAADPELMVAEVATLAVATLLLLSPRAAPSAREGS